MYGGTATKRSVTRLFTVALNVWRSTVLTCAVLLVANAPMAQAGVNVWTSHGPEGGPVVALAIDPITPSTLYAGRWNDGVFKSTDSCGSWSPANTGLTYIDVQALAIDPITPGTLYAGSPYGGVFKSTNSGDIWNDLNTDLTNTFVSALAIDPTTPSTLYVGTGGGSVFDIEQQPVGPTESLSGTVQYSGLQGPVFESHPIRLILFWNDPLQVGGEDGGDETRVDQTVVNENGGSFTLTAPVSGNYFLGYVLDVIPNGEGDIANVGEPFQFYNRRFVAPVDAIAVPQSGLSLDFDDSARLPGIAGMITYTGSKYGPVSRGRKLRVAMFSDPSLTDDTDEMESVVTNGGRYDSITFDTMPRYLRAWLDVNGNGQFDSDEPFEIYHGGDPVVPGPDQDAVNFQFGDPTTATCVGDCGTDGSVTVDEILTLVNIARGNAQLSKCSAGDANSDGQITVDEILTAVNNALNGCGGD